MIDPTPIVDALSKLTVVETSLIGQPIDQDIVEHFVNRLAMCIDDGCLKAASAYLEQMERTPEINTNTKLEVLQRYHKLLIKED